MEVKAFKTIKGKTPLKKSRDFSFSNKTEREEALICVFPDVEYQKIGGFGYNFGRVHINSCDFSLGNYTCVEDDETLETFNIKRDEQSVIPMIKDAMKYNDVKIFASSWSLIAYMKTNGEMNHGGKLKKEYESLWQNTL